MRRTLGLAAISLATLLPAAAYACGGFFCSAPAGPVPPQPVDQTAERIAFEVHGDDTVTAHVQISYTGPADEFAWIVPVPGTPDVDESDPQLFVDIDSPTALQVMLPPPEVCPVPVDGGRGGCVGCGGFGMAEDASGSLARGGTEMESGPVVTVHAEGTTDNYEFVVISADLASDLTQWLRERSYNVSDNMVPVMQPYIDGGMNYLAVRLQDGRTASDVAPLAMRYDGAEPMIPIQLTAVAAQPLMGIQVWIFGETPFLPENYAWERPATQDIFSDELGNTSYFAWVARTAAEADGQVWSAEFVGQNLTGRFPQHPVVSRFYTRLNPEQMTVDPVFASASDAEVISNLLDLSAQPTPFGCNGINTDVLPSLCAYNYCGRGASCGVVDGRVACKCADGDVAQDITNPDGTTGVTCVPPENPYGITAEAGGAGTDVDPCNEVDCGTGSCVLRNGFPTCDCDDPAFACLEDDGSILCVEPTGEPETFGPGAGSESGPVVASKQVETDGVRYAGAPWLPGLIVVGVLLGTRRRR